MNFELLGLPATLSLATIATLGYLMSRREQSVAAEKNAARQEMKQAQAVLQQLAAISQQMRKSLAMHHSTVMQFKSRLDRYQAQQEEVSLCDLSTEADRMIAPTEELATSIAQAYEGIRQTQQMTVGKKRIDRLTGVGDRLALAQSIEIMLGLRNKCDVPFSVAMFDIECFAAFNARAGRAAGDQVLCGMAGILDSRSRDCDLVARLGNDCFVVVLPGTDGAGAQAFARRMQPYLDAGLPTAWSVGTAEATTTDSLVNLLARSKQEMQASRNICRTNIRVHGGQGITRTSGQRVAEGANDKVSR